MRAAQEIFDTIVAHLRQQNCKSIGTGGCLYRGPNGTKCAVGCLIPDDDYDPAFEGKNILRLCMTDILPAYLSNEFRAHEYLLADLQNTHDDKAPANWEEMFAIIAEKYNLTYTAPNAS